jgi:hypothetical protein
MSLKYIAFLLVFCLRFHPQIVIQLHVFNVQSLFDWVAIERHSIRLLRPLQHRQHIWWPAPPLQLSVNAATTSLAISTLTFIVSKIAEVGRLLSVHRDVSRICYKVDIGDFHGGRYKAR